MIKRFYLFISGHSKLMIWLAIFALLSLVGIPMIMNLVDNRIKYDWDYKDYGDVKSDSPFGAKYYYDHLKEIWGDKIEIDDMGLERSLEKHNGKKCNYIVFDSNSNEDNYEYVVSADDEEYTVADDNSRHLNKKTLKYCKKVINAVGTGNNIVFCSPTQVDNYAMYILPHAEKRFFVSDFKSNYAKPQRKLLNYIQPKTNAVLDTVGIWSNMLENKYNLFENVFFYNKADIQGYYAEFGMGITSGLLKYQNTHYYVVCRKIGNGKAIVNGISLLFSNYALSAPDVLRVSDKLLMYALDKRLPLVIVNMKDNKKVADNSNTNAYDENKNMLYVMFDTPATKVATYLLIVMLLFVIVINSRRRVRVAKENKLEDNSSLSYIRHLATLYSKKTDYKELLEIEQRKILYQLRKDYCFDIRTNGFTKPSEYSAFIAKSKGGNEENIRMALMTLESLVSEQGVVSDEGYMACLKLLNDAVYSLDNK